MSTPMGPRVVFHDLPADDDEFMREARRIYHMDVESDRHNIEPAREDIQFVTGDQWDLNVKTRRTRLNKPALTVNRLPAFVAQYLGSWQQTDTTMLLRPMKGGTKKIAELRQGLIRSILKDPNADHATYTAMETAYICGVGSFGISLVENRYDLFEKDVVLKAYDDPFQVVWDRQSREPTGADARHVWAMEYITKEQFKKIYPNATSFEGWQGDEFDYTRMTSYGWDVDEMVRVCHFWCMKEEDVKLGLEVDSGDIVDVTDWTDEQIEAGIARDRNGELMLRETVRPYAECHVLSGQEILDGPYRLNISRVPVFRVEGWALQEASVRHRWGFVRHAKDPQRIHNYWRSVLAEELMKSNASKWLLDQAAMRSGLAEQFRNSHLSGDNVLFWDSQSAGAKPELIPPPMLNGAVLTEAQMSVQDIKDVTNKHEASMGVTSNEVSGRAITARQRVSELGDRIYLENMNRALSECAKVINELIPEVYDTNRVIKVMGEDDQVLMQEINGDFGDETPDITRGKYDLTFTTGPSYATKREEAVDTMLTMMNHMPQTANYIADIIARNMDIPGADEIADRMMALLPPQLVDTSRMSEQKRAKFEAAQQAQQQQAQQQEAMQMEMFKRQLGELEAKIQNLSAGAMKSQAQAQLAASQAGVDATKVMSQHEIGTDKNLIDAARVGLDLQRSEIDALKMGMESAYKGVELERQAEPQPTPNTPQTPQE